VFYSIKNWNGEPKKLPHFGKNACGNDVFGFEKRENVTQNVV